MDLFAMFNEQSLFDVWINSFSFILNEFNKYFRMTSTLFDSNA